MAQPLPPNIERDAKTVAAMVRIYCAGRHGTNGQLCDPCGALLGYAHERLEKCPFGEEQTTCRDCPIHCGCSGAIPSSPSATFGSSSRGPRRGRLRAGALADGATASQGRRRAGRTR